MTSPTPTPDSPAVTAATTTEGIAAKIRQVIATLLSIVPNLMKFDKRQTKRIAASAKFGAESIMPTSIMVTTLLEGKVRSLFDVEGGHLAKQYDDQLTPLVKQIAGFAADFQYTIDNMLAVVAVQALAVYRWAQHAAKQPGGAELQPYVDQMAEVIRKTMNHRKAVAPAPSPTPTAPRTPATPGAQGFLASSTAHEKTGEPEDIADLFERLLLEAAE
jgi:phage tail tape-measure protein